MGVDEEVAANASRRHRREWRKTEDEGNIKTEVGVGQGEARWARNSGECSWSSRDRAAEEACSGGRIGGSK
jgi:hypothetical protein